MAVTGTDQDVRISRKQEEALVGLMLTNSTTDAAQRAGVNERTVRRWMGTEAFRAEYRTRAREASGQALTALMGAQLRAVQVMAEGLDAESPAVRVRAASRLLEIGLKLREDDVEERLADLERALREQEAEGQG